MEFLRFGSSIPGSYWGCCAVDIIQNFKVDPDEKASIQLVSGDGGAPITKSVGNKQVSLFAGPTWRDIFWQRIRFGTFDKRDMPNHAFLAILTDGQVSGGVGKKWLKILHEAGFEFIRTVDNSVYSGQTLKTGTSGDSRNKNYLFGLFRNIGNGAVEDPFAPPPQWTALGENKKTQLEIWTEHQPKPLLTEEELDELGAPVWYAGCRSLKPQQIREHRKNYEDSMKKMDAAVAKTSSFPVVKPAPAMAAF